MQFTISMIKEPNSSTPDRSVRHISPSHPAWNTPTDCSEDHTISIIPIIQSNPIKIFLQKYDQYLKILILNLHMRKQGENMSTMMAWR